MYTIKNRYLVLIGALLAQLTIAGLYAWSIFSSALQAQRGWTDQETFLPYALAQFIFALTTLISGRLVDKKGPRPALFIGGVLYGSGLILSAFVTQAWMLYITYGLILGAGVGFVYVCPLSTLIKWFPDKKGLITGLAVAIFGGGSILFKEIKTSLLASYTISESFLILGLVSLVTIVIGGLLTNNPQEDKKTKVEKTVGDYSSKEMVKTKDFKAMWFMYWLAVTPGLLILGTAKQIGMDVASLDSSLASGVISVLALANATSRLVSGSLSDRFGTLRVLRGIYILTVISLVTLSFMGHVQPVFYLAVAGVAVGYGGFLSLFPTLTLQKFGSFRYGSNYGIVFQAYGLAALTGIFIKDLAGSYTMTFIISAISSVVGLYLAMTLKDKPEATALKKAS